MATTGGCRLDVDPITFLLQLGLTSRTVASVGERAMDLRVLGPLRVLGDGGRPIRIASHAQRRLLSRLAVDAGSIVRTAVLEDDLGLTPNALRTSISRLRLVIGAEHLLTSPPGYELVPARIDAAEFEAHLARAREHPRSKPDRRSSPRSGSGPGDAFVDDAHEPWAEAEAARLTELHSGALEDLVAAAPRRG